MTRKKVGQKKRRISDDDSAAEKAGFSVIKTHPRVLLSLIYFCFSVSSNHTFFSIWLSSQFNQSPDKMLGVCCSVPGVEDNKKILMLRHVLHLAFFSYRLLSSLCQLCLPRGQ